MKSMKELAISLGVGEDIVFTGFREEVLELVSMMDILVLCSSIEGSRHGFVRSYVCEGAGHSYKYCRD